jgi:hypothetical protein
MKHIINQYSESYKKYGNFAEALFWTKGRQELRFEKLSSLVTGKACYIGATLICLLLSL